MAKKCMQYRESRRAHANQVRNRCVRCGRARALFKIGDDVVGLCPTPDHRRFLATINVEEAAAPAIVVDLGTATTVDAVDASGGFRGGNAALAV